MTTALSTTKFDYAGFTDAEAASLRDAAAKIRAAGQKAVEGYFEIGRQLILARKQFDQYGRRQDGGENGEWVKWIEKEIGFSLGAANRIKAMTKKFGRATSHDQLPPIGVLFEITPDDTPNAVVQHVLEHPETTMREARQLGKDIKAQEATAEIQERPLSTVSEARVEARETHHPVLARDGKIYFGATKEEGERAAERRKLIYSVREAIELLADLEVTPAEWVEEARPWQFHDFNTEDEITTARNWLDTLVFVWEHRNG